MTDAVSESAMLDVSEALARARARGAPLMEVRLLLDERNRLVLEAYAARVPVMDICAFADISKWMVWKIRRRHHVPARPRCEPT